MVAKFSDDNNREFLQRRRRTAKKTKGRDWQKRKVFARASSFFVRFLAVVARPRHETSEFHALAGAGEHKTQSLLFFF